jgi:hypothetical protein
MSLRAVSGRDVEADAGERAALPRIPDVLGRGRPLGESDYYIGLPIKAFLAAFDGFEPVDEAAVPKVVDVFLLGDNNEFNRRFQFRHNLPR